MSAADLVDFTLALLLGVLVAVSELVSRYKDAPGKALSSRPGIAYLLINGAGSAIALALIRTFDINFGLDPGSSAHRVTQVLVAGVGAIAFFRSSLFNVTIRDVTIGVGPNVLLVVILTVLDRGVERKRAQARSAKIGEIMKGFDFDRSVNALQLYCIDGLMQNPTADDREGVARVIKDLDDSDVPNSIKSYVLGLSLMNIVGAEALEDAVRVVKSTQAAGSTSEATEIQPAPETETSRRNAEPVP